MRIVGTLLVAALALSPACKKDNKEPPAGGSGAGRGPARERA